MLENNEKIGNKEKIDNKEINEICPKCKSHDIIFQGNWTGMMVSDLYAEHFWTCKCKSCGFTFAPITEENKPDPINFKRDYF